MHLESSPSRDVSSVWDPIQSWSSAIDVSTRAAKLSSHLASLMHRSRGAASHSCVKELYKSLESRTLFQSGMSSSLFDVPLNGCSKQHCLYYGVEIMLRGRRDKGEMSYHGAVSAKRLQYRPCTDLWIQLFSLWPRQRKRSNCAMCKHDLSSQISRRDGLFSAVKQLY